MTFSRYYPKYHPKAGQDTYFVEKIWQCLFNMGISYNGTKPGLQRELETFSNPSHFIKPKHHTIRAGYRWQTGQTFTPRVWSGKPYASKQITIAPDIEITSTHLVTIEKNDDYICMMVDHYPFYEENATMVTQSEALETLAKNDGLSVDDFKAWFKWPKNFTGQIICWNKEIEY